MIRRLRSTRQLFVFAPVHDLSGAFVILLSGESRSKSRAAIGAAEANQLSAPAHSARSRFAKILQEGGELAGDEWARQIVHRRTGVTLRSGAIASILLYIDSGSMCSRRHYSQARRLATDWRRRRQRTRSRSGQPTQSSGMQSVCPRSAYGGRHRQCRRDRQAGVDAATDLAELARGAPSAH